MIRKLILSAALAAGAVVGLALAPATAEAHPPVRTLVRHERHIRPIRQVRFEVQYLECGRWDCYGSFASLAQAERVACRLRDRGQQARVVRC